MKLVPHSLLLALTLSPMLAQAGRPPLELPLWNDAPPGVIAGAGSGVLDNTGRFSDVGIPALVVHFPETDGENRPVLIVCPGGGYHRLYNFSVGSGTIPRFLPRNVVVAVLRYRTRPPYPNPDEMALLDARRAVRLVRANARSWGIDPAKVGMVGWSAGANLILNLATHGDRSDATAPDPVERESSRPDLVGLMSPWPWKYKNRPNPMAAYPVTKEAPPAFVASARDDDLAPTTFAEAIVAAWKNAGVEAELWQIDAGGHTAFGAQATGEGKNWGDKFWDWIGLHFPDWQKH